MLLHQRLRKSERLKKLKPCLQEENLHWALVDELVQVSESGTASTAKVLWVHPSKFLSLKLQYINFNFSEDQASMQSPDYYTSGTYPSFFRTRANHGPPSNHEILVGLQ
jgi:hypothetical protein